MVYIETEEGGRLATLHLARFLAVAAGASGLCLATYVIVRLLHIRRADFAVAPTEERTRSE